jgi:hypothetical protein
VSEALFSSESGRHADSATGSCAVFGFSQLALFVSAYAYLIQTHGLYSALALAVACCVGM